MQTKRRYTNKNRGKRMKRGKRRCRTMKAGAPNEVCDELTKVDSGLLEVFRSSVQLPKIMFHS